MEREYKDYEAMQGLPANSGELRYILDSVNAKYNNSIWKTFTDVLPASKSKKFSVLLDETKIVVKASPVGSMGQKPIRSFEGAELYSDSIQKIGHAFIVGQEDLNDIEELNLVNTIVSDEMLKRYNGRAQALIGGFHATWNGWILEALAKQQITVSSQGKQPYVLDLRVPSANKLKVKSANANWFDADTTKYDIIEDLTRMNKRADDDDVNMSSDRVFVCAKSLRDKIMLDPTVIAKLKARMPWATADLALTNADIEKGISTSFSLPPIIAIDEKSRIEVNGEAVLGKADFDENMISLIPLSKLFDMHNSPSDYSKDTNPAVTVTTIEGGLIGILEKRASDPIQVMTSMEAWAFPSFKNPKKIVSLNTAEHSATGK